MSGKYWAKKPDVAILLPKKKTVFKAKSIIKDNEGQYRIMEGIILLEVITVICFYAS